MLKDEDRIAFAESFNPEPNEYMTETELMARGFVQVGKNTKISRKCSFYGCDGWIGHDVRIDDFCIIKGRVTLHPFVHLAAYCMVSGAHAPVVLKDFVGVAARATILSGSDDYSADTLGNPCTPPDYTTIIKGPVTIGLGTMVGAHVVILPNVTIGEGASIGSGCVIARDVPNGGVVRMAPPILKDRRRDHIRIKAFAVRVYENMDGEP